ncbi:MAG: alanine racemase, partial [Verrucomicrobiota bacterium]|nr:alanine racemase [Verrucomicrobiota bacterium]
LLQAAAHRATDLRVVVDSKGGVRALSEAARRNGCVAGALLEIDVGLHRCGLAEEDPMLLPLVRSICASSDLRFVGLLSHAGHAYGASTRQEVAQIAAEECAILRRVRGRLEAAGIEVSEVSVGSTPTVLAGDSWEGITEIRPGNYAFLDRTPVRLGLVGMDRVALTVLTTVVSANAHYLIVDAGSKVLSSDRGAHGTAAVADDGLAFPLGEEKDPAAALHVVKLSEEHGFIERGSGDLPLGSKLRIVPNHACPVVNLADSLTAISGEREIAHWRVAARAKTR